MQFITLTAWMFALVSYILAAPASRWVLPNCTIIGEGDPLKYRTVYFYDGVPYEGDIPCVGIVMQEGQCTTLEPGCIASKAIETESPIGSWYCWYYTGADCDGASYRQCGNGSPLGAAVSGHIGSFMCKKRKSGLC
ncbi:hypothetical protein EJ04DRAFT_529815 [Polyplosphaeria fusca]|uniref:Uncharacterized protein n=1 Tax=Polyplosphaeria fusca TaxID=682080 RepID=A0A9P4QLE4_9PLEO|nr:hypothetical protein EJ04DRAFT_529815 [Polyplosphaeria fusca]